MSQGSWKKTASEYVFQSKWVSLRRDVYQTPHGKTIDDFYIVERDDFIVIVPQAVDGRYILVSQYRHGVEDVVLNFPKAMIDGNETPEAAAVRELREETGYTSTHIKNVGTLLLAPPLMKTKAHVLSAQSCIYTNTGGPTDLDEIDACVLKSSQEVEQLIASGELNDAISVAAFYSARQ